MNKHFFFLILLLFCAATLLAQKEATVPPPEPLDVWDPRPDTMLLSYDVAPWPASDSLLLPEFREGGGCPMIMSKVHAFLFVAKDGMVKATKIVARPKGLGYEELIEPVVEQWRFTPASEDGEALGTWISVRFRFEGSENGLDPDSFVKCQHYAKVEKQPDPLTVYTPPIIVLCPN